VRGQLCATASLFPVKEPPVCIDNEAEGAPDLVNTLGERELLPQPRTDPQFR